LNLAGIPASAVFELGAVDQEVALELPGLVAKLVALIERLEPELVLTHPYEGGHPDHDATALLAHVSCEVLRRRGHAPPALGEFASYHERDGSLAFGEFVPSQQSSAVSVELSPLELEHKLAMLECHETQRGVWRLFPVGVERFRAAPSYDFSRPPAAPFFYDRVDWGLRGDDFLALSRAALAKFGIEGSC
jgi:LmbE family N-acetylglucosaminyl deacetylase